MNPYHLIYQYYKEDNALRRLLLVHSRQVADKALAVARRHPELRLNAAMLEWGGMLHDIGIFLTHAPGIFCYGDADYLMHGCLGGRLLRQEGLPLIAQICERHTGTGLLPSDFEKRGLPVPVVKVQPETLEEKVVSYADKFYSKSNVEKVKTVSQIEDGLRRFSRENAERFMAWHKLFG